MRAGRFSISAATLFETIGKEMLIYLIVLFWVMPSILQLVRQKITALGKSVDYVVFCLSDQFLMYQDWSIKNIAVFIVTGIAFSITGIAVLQEKDL